jgi:hypothetical protein
VLVLNWVHGDWRQGSDPPNQIVMKNESATPAFHSAQCARSNGFVECGAPDACKRACCGNAMSEWGGHCGLASCRNGPVDLLAFVRTKPNLGTPAALRLGQKIRNLTRSSILLASFLGAEERQQNGLAKRSFPYGPSCPFADCSWILLKLA